MDGWFCNFGPSIKMLHVFLGSNTVQLHLFLEERPDVFCSLCMAAAHMAAQDPAGADFFSFGGADGANGADPC